MAYISNTSYEHFRHLSKHTYTFFTMHRRVCLGTASLVGSITVFACLYAMSARVHWEIFKPSLRRLLLLVMTLSVIDYVWTIFWWIAYKPSVTLKDATALPYISVVMPVYNESHFVCYSLRSILASSYPREKLEVVVIDDGSTDNTAKHIAEMVPIFFHAGVRFRNYQHKRNLGKRFAIKNGFEMATGEIIVSLDSDSVLERDTLQALVSPLTQDKAIGGVAGHLSVLNVEENLVPKLLDILFDASGNIPRAAQSRACGVVTILPGALSAFRASAVRPLIETLCNTMFWGTTMRHGEDVELTLGLVRSGWKTVYQRSAVVHTIAPKTVRAALLTYTRWERSSYIYLFSGFIQLAASAVVDELSHELAPGSESQHPDLTELIGADTDLHLNKSSSTLHESVFGRLFLLINLVSTATGNLFLPCIIYAHIRSALFEFRNIPLQAASVFLLSIFQTLLFVADLDSQMEQEDEQPIESRHTNGSSQLAATEKVSSIVSIREKISSLPTIIDREARLRWRLQYCGIAVLFHASVIVWASLLAVITLRSQKWLTR